MLFLSLYVCVSVYDVTSAESFDHVEEWLSEVDRYANENTSKLLVGNKADLVELKQVQEETAQVRGMQSQHGEWFCFMFLQAWSHMLCAFLCSHHHPLLFHAALGCLLLRDSGSDYATSFHRFFSTPCCFFFFLRAALC
jgi:hypothetical protein